MRLFRKTKQKKKESVIRNARRLIEDIEFAIGLP